MSLRRYSRPKRIDIDLEKMIEDIQIKEKIPFREASRELAKSMRFKLKDIKF